MTAPPRPTPPGAAPRDWHALDPEAVLRALGGSPHGLSEAEARARLDRLGPNALRAARAASAWKVLLDQLRSVVVLLLVAAAGVALVAGDVVEAIAIGAVLLINTLLGFVTELRARRAMEALLRLEAPRAAVRRDGRVRELDARGLVPGDVVLLEPGQAVPADARLLHAADLRVSEAALTGESLPVDKTPAAVAPDTPLPDRTSLVYQGTTVAAGTAEAVVVATGMDTELGHIGGLVGGIPDERTPLERRLDALGRRLVALALAVAAVVVALGALRGLPFGTMLETGIALAIAAVPEGLPAVSTIALAVGVRRMARRHALVRRLPSVETLGSVTVVCTDKTGTLTAGEMTVTAFALDDCELEVTGAGYDAEGEFLRDGVPFSADDPRLAAALRVAALAGHAEVTRRDEGWEVRGDPTEAALLVAARKGGVEREALLAEAAPAGEVPFSSERMFMATFHRSGARLAAYAKGAPGRLIPRCSRVLTAEGEAPLDEAGRERLLARNAELAARGLRVLALACGTTDRAEEAALDGLTFAGLAGMMDPPAEGVPETIRTLRDAGIRTMMITGDQRLTAEAVGRELGILEPADEVLDGRELRQIAPAELPARVRRVAAFSRVSPEDKLAIVAAVQARGDIVAMLGDGVNDAAALKKADVGVAMGIRGTDVAKEAAAVVLQDDRFRTISAAVEEGRVIFDNIRKFVFYLFSCNLAEVLVLLFAGLLGLPLPLLPLQILWLNLVTDTFPALALAVEPADAGVMRRPPRDPREAILSASFLRTIAVYALLITGVTLVAFLIGLSDRDPGSQRAVTLSFMTLGLAQAFHLGNARSHVQVLSPRRIVANRWAVAALALVVAAQIVVVTVPPLAGLLGLEPLGGRDWLLVLGLAAVPAVIGQGVRLVGARRRAAS